MQNSCYSAALRYAALGLRPIPLRPGTKTPALARWQEQASSDPANVAQQFRDAAYKWPSKFGPNVGIATGNGLAVLDVDTKHGAERPDWAPDTVTVRTPSGGLHLYYAVAGPVPNSVGRLAPGIDVRGERGQVAAPPSRLDGERDGIANTGRYEWVGLHFFATVPAELLTPEDMRRDFAGRSPHKFQFRDEVPVGERNNYLTSLAGFLFASGEHERGVLEQLRVEVMRLGFTPREGEVESIVRSVARYH